VTFAGLSTLRSPTPPRMSGWTRSGSATITSTEETGDPNAVHRKHELARRSVGHPRARAPWAVARMPELPSAARARESAATIMRSAAAG
jgi:hypothetical protein